MDPGILELVEQGGPWAWAVLIAVGLLWLPNLGLSVTAATGRRVPTAAFLALVLFLAVLAATGSWAGLLDVRHDLTQVGAGDRVRVAGQGMELAWIPVILLGRLAPALCTIGAVAVALGAWMRAPDTRWSAPQHAILPVLLGMLGAGVGLAVDLRLAVAALGATIALGIVSMLEDDDPRERRSLAARRSRVAVLGLASVSIALAGAASAAIARADGMLALDPWPLAESVAFYTPSSVLQRYTVLPAGLAPLGLVGLAGLVAVLPISTRLGGWRTWLGGALSAVVVAALLGLFGGVTAMHTATWGDVLPPRTQVAVPRVEQVLHDPIRQSPPEEQRLTWTPRGIQVDGVPVRRVALGMGVAGSGPDAALRGVVRYSAQRRAEARWSGTERPAPWDLEVPAVALARDVQPLLRVLLDEDPAVRVRGVELIATGIDGYAGTIRVQVQAAPGPDGSIDVGGDATWDDIVARVALARSSARAAVLVVGRKE